MNDAGGREIFRVPRMNFVPVWWTCVGGRAAEEIVFDSVTTGASNDIEHGDKDRQGHGDAVWYVRRNLV